MLLYKLLIKFIRNELTMMKDKDTNKINNNTLEITKIF